MKIHPTLRSAVSAYLLGEGDFARFARETTDTWTAVAIQLCRRWSMPDGCGPDDVAQELLLGAWRALPKADARRGDVAAHVLYSAISAAKCWIHHQRGASLHRPEHQRSRFLPSVSAATRVAAEDAWLPEPVDPAPLPAEQLEEAEAPLRAVEAALARLPLSGDRLVALAYLEARGGRLEAARMLYGNPTTRRQLRLDRERDGLRHVMRAEATLMASIDF